MNQGFAKLDCWDRRMSVRRKNAYIADFSLLTLRLLVCGQLEVAAREHAHLWMILFRVNSLSWLFPTYRLIVVATSDEFRNHPLKTGSIWINRKQRHNWEILPEMSMTSSLEPIRATFELWGREFVTTIWRKRSHQDLLKWLLTGL